MHAKKKIAGRFNYKQQDSLDLVLSHQISVGVEELDEAKLTPLLRPRYQDSIADAVADLGRPEDIGHVFVSFQKHLYTQPTVQVSGPRARHGTWPALFAKSSKGAKSPASAARIAAM